MFLPSFCITNSYVQPLAGVVIFKWKKALFRIGEDLFLPCVPPRLQSYLPLLRGAKFSTKLRRKRQRKVMQRGDGHFGARTAQIDPSKG